MRRPWRDKNIPGKRVVKAKVPGSQAPSGRRRSAAWEVVSRAEARMQSSLCPGGRCPSLGIQLGLPRNCQGYKSQAFWSAFLCALCFSRALQVVLFNHYWAGGLRGPYIWVFWLRPNSVVNLSKASSTIRGTALFLF